MELETPLQPVTPRRGWRDPAILVAALLVVAVGLLVWRPWSGADDGRGLVAAPSASPWVASPSDAVAAMPVSASPAASPPASPFPSPTSDPPTPTGELPSANLFARQWSIVAIFDPSHAGPDAVRWVTQQPVTVSRRPLPIRSGPPRWICPLPGEFRRPLAAHAPAGKVRLIGVAFPPSEGAWGVTVAVEEGSALAIREIYLRDIPPHMTPPLTPWVRVFALADGGVWPAGIYRFTVAFPDASHRYLYACVGV
ncbi:MAG: hypothetical protein A2X23_10330 [Chloroflexi bacterium GWC2_73_18]|nr:MAG: hypothetical protein A2X23_10330 [Chloroflexi bacterium GWC2_73_18]